MLILIMKINIKIQPKISYIISALTSVIFLIYFAYKGSIAYLIHRELYGGGIDPLVALRFTLCGVMIFLTFLFIQFMKIKDLKSQRTILKGVFIGWSSIFIFIFVLFKSSIYFIILTGSASFISLIASFSLIKQIKEERNSLTDKEIYLLQKLAKKK
tara:strand:- start:60 stop:530 length:471 start_codon:yes stop_codon:yes gene_type:complete